MDVAERNKLAEENIKLVVVIATRMKMGLPHRVALDDLISDGNLGLLSAASRFDPSRGVKFTTWASKRIRGAMMDGLRDRNWSPRRVLKRITVFNGTIQTLQHELGRPPRSLEIAERMGIDLEEVRAIEFDIVSTRDGHAPGFPDPKDLMRDHAASSKPVDQDMSFEDQVDVLTSRLSGRNKLIFKLYHVEGLTMKAVAGKIGMSESRICQILRKITLKLTGPDRLRIPA